MNALTDTSFLLATVAERDQYHTVAREALLKIQDNRQVVAAVLPEVFYMTMVRVGYEAAVSLVRQITTSGIPIIPLVDADYRRMDGIMRQYRDAKFDFVDVAQMAVAERLNIQRIYTFDRRDFVQFKPRHTDHLQLLP